MDDTGILTSSILDYPFLLLRLPHFDDVIELIRESSTIWFYKIILYIIEVHDNN